MPTRRSSCWRVSRSMQNQEPGPSVRCTQVIEHSKDAELQHIARLRLARVQIDQGKPDEALQTLSDPPGTFAARYDEVRGDAYYAKKDSAKAAELYKKALGEGDPQSMDSALLALKIADLGLVPAAVRPPRQLAPALRRPAHGGDCSAAAVSGLSRFLEQGQTLMRSLLPVALAALLVAAGCSKDKDVEPPAKLVAFPQTLPVKELWGDGVGGGKKQVKLRLGLGPAYDNGLVFAASRQGRARCGQSRNRPPGLGEEIQEDAALRGSRCRRRGWSWWAPARAG